MTGVSTSKETLLLKCFSVNSKFTKYFSHIPRSNSAVGYFTVKACINFGVNYRAECSNRKRYSVSNCSRNYTHNLGLRRTSSEQCAARGQLLHPRSCPSSPSTQLFEKKGEVYTTNGKDYKCEEKTSYGVDKKRMKNKRKEVEAEGERVSQGEYEEQEQFLHVSNLCKKIYHLSRSGIKNEKQWENYLIEIFKEEKNYKFIKVKNIFMLLLGLTKCKDTIKSINYAEEGRKKINSSKLVDTFIEILSHKINEMMNNQLSILLHIMEKWKKIEKYEDIVNKIKEKILINTSSKKLNVRTFSSVLHLYSKHYWGRNGIGGKGGSDPIPYIHPQIHKFVDKLTKTTFRLEDMLCFLSSLHRLKIKIKDKCVLESIIQMLNAHVKEGNYLLAPSVLLCLANLNIYNEELFLKLKYVVLQNYHFYNSVHLTNVFYAFSKFKPSFLDDLFQELADHIMHSLAQAGKMHLSVSDKAREKAHETWVGHSYDTFNIFQVTNIINCSLNCNYLNYDFFDFLLLESNKREKENRKKGEQSLDNLISLFGSISKIIKTFSSFFYKHEMCFHHVEREKPRRENLPFERVKIDESSNEGKGIEHTYFYTLSCGSMSREVIDQESHEQQETYEYISNRQPSDGLSFVIDFCPTFSEQGNLQKKFITHMNNVGKRIRRAIENNLLDKNLKDILHNLMLTLSFSETRFLNLYALGYIITIDNLHLLSVNNLYLYLTIWHKRKIYDLYICHLIFEHINKYWHQLELKKKIKIVFLSCNIFNKVSEWQMDFLFHFFLNGYNCSEGLPMEGSSSPSRSWDLPTVLHLKRNFPNTGSFSRKENVILNNNVPNDNVPSVDVDILSKPLFDNADVYGEGITFKGCERISGVCTPVGEKKKEEILDITSKDFFFKRIEKTETLPCPLEFEDYLTFLLILIHYKKDDPCKDMELIALISKEDNGKLIKIEEGEPLLEKYSNMVRDNLFSRRNYIVNFFSKIANLLEKENEKGEKSGNDPTEPAYQLMYMLYFIKLMNEDIYEDIMKIEKIKNYFFPTAIEKNTTPLINKAFELKREDMQYILSARKTNLPHIMQDIFNEGKANYRFQYKSVHEAVHVISNNIKKIQYNQSRSSTDSKNKLCDFKKIEIFYKLDRFLISDIFFVLERNNERFFHFLLFYPDELKKNLVNRKEEALLFTRKYDPSLLFTTEMVFAYNILKKNLPKGSCFSVVDASPFVILSTCEWEGYNMEGAKAERVNRILESVLTV
ncbi:conserved Plasmodium protein, unknown function [Plasmodium ovale]|uniref:Uncharacterized protein n=1 Tax=Plasmodium ovale TaxID=36330 RepID=A0A1C3KNR7_PLAOA|nr:conserved Plasmodium protein, unknown function [Plasmodium ovale]